MRILTVTANETDLQHLVEASNLAGCQALTARTTEEAWALCRDYAPQLVIVDLRLPADSGIDLLRRIKDGVLTRACSVVLLAAADDRDGVVEGLRAGAYDVLDHPLERDSLVTFLRLNCERWALFHAEDDARERSPTPHLDAASQEAFIAESSAMQRILHEARLYANDPALPVLIEGETGTGKDRIARMIHAPHHSTSSPFVDINCSAVSATLFESELFGYSSGAFTGADTRGRVGKMELAGQGTLFLDEIGDMPLNLQPKLLRVLEDRAFYPVGGVQKRLFRARIIAATNQSLRERVASGTFRRDLFHRIHLGYIHIPPLRERPEDLEMMARRFLLQAAVARKKQFRSIVPETYRCLRAYPWPGNVRELQNMIERAVLINDDTALRPEHLPDLHTSGGGSYGESQPQSFAHHIPLPEEGLDLKEWTETLIRRAYEHCDQHQGRTASYLGMSRHALRRKLTQMGLVVSR